MADYTVITHLTPWGQSYNGSNALLERRHVGSRTKYLKFQDDLCNEWNRTHEQKAWIDGTVYLEWPERHTYEKLYDLYLYSKDLLEGNKQDVEIGAKINAIISPDDLGTAVEFSKVKARREYLANHPEC